MITAARGSPPEKGEGGTCLQQARPQIKNTTHEFSYPRAQSVKPIFPDADFLPGRVLGILLTGRRYTHKDAWLELGHSRLADSIWKLRRNFGWPIQTDEKVVATKDAGRSAQIGIYHLPPAAIAEAGERGQRYAAECARVEAKRRAAK